MEDREVLWVEVWSEKGGGGSECGVGYATEGKMCTLDIPSQGDSAEKTSSAGGDL